MPRLVSSLAGTTRDYLVAPLSSTDCCELVDTAGHQAKHDDELSAAAGDAATRQIGQADIQLFCLDATRSASDWEREQLANPSGAAARLVVWTKADAATEKMTATEKGVRSLL